MSTNYFRRIQLVVRYDGTDFKGWATQTGLRTVQSTLKNTVRQVSGEDVEILGASRTDSGAHAKGQSCHFDTSVDIADKNWVYALNRMLPDDCSVLKAISVAKTFHARFSALNRWYRYSIMIGQRDPFDCRYAHCYYREIDVEAMHTAAQSLVGRFDFRAYSEQLEKSANAIREIHKISVKAKGKFVHIDVVGAAFLRGMMRRISGSLLEVGRETRPPGEIGEMLNLQKRDTINQAEVLPAKGLTLMRVQYGRPYYGQEQKLDFEQQGITDE